jgi:hypothetical protein
VTVSGISRTGARPFTSATLYNRRTGESQDLVSNGGTA